MRRHALPALLALFSSSALTACGDGRHFEHEPVEALPSETPSGNGPGASSGSEAPQAPVVLARGLSVDEVVDNGLRLEVHALQWGDDGAIELLMGATDSARDAAVVGIGAASLEFAEDGVDLGPEALFTVERERALHVALVLDTSKSMVEAGADAALRDAARGLVDALPPSTRLAVVPFATRYETRVPFTSDKAQVLDALETLVPPLDRSGQFTNLWGALVHASDALGGAAEASTGGRAVVVFTDGQDNVAEASTDEAAAHLQAAGATLYAVGLGERLDRDALTSLSGAQRFAETTDPQALGGLFDDIGARLSELARIRYITPKQSGEHVLDVKVSDGPRSARLRLRFDLG